MVMTQENADLGRFTSDFPNTLNDDALFLWPEGNKEPTLNKHPLFKAPLLKCAELTFSVCVGYLPAFEWINGNPFQSLMILC